MRFAVDTGGTFTDLVVEDDSGLCRLYKAATTPHDPVAGMLDALTVAAEADGRSLPDFLARGNTLLHGTTHAINAIITGRTARTALLTTSGHGDILVLREGGRAETFNFTHEFPEPYIPRSLTFEVPERVMADASLAFADLDRIGVTIGPGSFTGLRVGLAFAKGLGAALSIPVVGVGTLAALAEPLGDELVFAAIDARRGQIYLQAFAAGRALMAPDALDLATAAARVAELSGGRQAVLVGSGAPLLADLMPGARQIDVPACDPAAVARLAAAQINPPSPRPLYLRAPDARLPGGAPGPYMA